MRRIVEGVVVQVAPLLWRRTVSVSVEDEDSGDRVAVVVDLQRPWDLHVGDWLSVEVEPVGGSLHVVSGIWQQGDRRRGRPRTASRVSG